MQESTEHYAKVLSAQAGSCGASLKVETIIRPFQTETRFRRIIFTISRGSKLLVMLYCVGVDS